MEGGWGGGYVGGRVGGRGRREREGKEKKEWNCSRDVYFENPVFITILTFYETGSVKENFYFCFNKYLSRLDSSIL